MAADCFAPENEIRDRHVARLGLNVVSLADHPDEEHDHYRHLDYEWTGLGVVSLADHPDEELCVHHYQWRTGYLPPEVPWHQA